MSSCSNVFALYIHSNMVWCFAWVTVLTAGSVKTALHFHLDDNFHMNKKKMFRIEMYLKKQPTSYFSVAEVGRIVTQRGFSSLLPGLMPGFVKGSSVHSPGQGLLVCTVGCFLKISSFLLYTVFISKPNHFLISPGSDYYNCYISTKHMSAMPLLWYSLLLNCA